MRTEDGSIIQECLDGKPEAFGVLVDKYKAGIYSFVCSEIKNLHDAEDVTQEVFLQAYIGLRGLRRWESFAFWLYRIARNLSRKWLRTQSRRPDNNFIEDQDTSVLEKPSLDSYSESQRSEYLWDALNFLPDTYREVLLLHYFGGMTIKDMSQAIGTSPAAIGMRLSRARAQMKEEMITIMNTAFEEQRLQSSFTFRIVETIKRIKINPMPRVAGLPWGFSATMGIIIAVLSLNPNLIISNYMPVAAGSLPSSKVSVLKTGELTVDVINISEVSVISSKQDDDASNKPAIAIQQKNAFLAPQAGGDKWMQKADMPTARAGTCSAIVNRKIYVIGGGADLSKLDTMKVEEYDPKTDTWVRKADGPGSGRAFCSASVVDGKIYIVGGMVTTNALKVATSIVEEYDPTTGIWSRKADMPTERAALSTGAVNGKIYAIGGTETPESFRPMLSTAEEYDPKTNTWTKKADMPTVRSNLSTCTVNGKIYAIGGWNGNNHIGTVEEYDPTMDAWTKKADMLNKRANLSTAEVNGKIYAIGGSFSTTPLPCVEEYDPQTDTWVRKADMPTARAALSAEAFNGKIYAIGGAASIINPNAHDIPALTVVEEYDTGFIPLEDSSHLDPKGKSSALWGEIKKPAF